MIARGLVINGAHVFIVARKAKQCDAASSALNAQGPGPCNAQLPPSVANPPRFTVHWLTRPQHALRDRRRASALGANGYTLIHQEHHPADSAIQGTNQTANGTSAQRTRHPACLPPLTPSQAPATSRLGLSAEMQHLW